HLNPGSERWSHETLSKLGAERSRVLVQGGKTNERRRPGALFEGAERAVNLQGGAHRSSVTREGGGEREGQRVSYRPPNLGNPALEELPAPRSKFVCCACLVDPIPCAEAHGFDRLALAPFARKNNDRDPEA